MKEHLGGHQISSIRQGDKDDNISGNKVKKRCDIYIYIYIQREREREREQLCEGEGRRESMCRVRSF